MTTLEILDRLQGDALKDGELRKKLLATRLEKDPLTVFCRLCRELGYELYEMDLVSAGEDFYATMRRSTNGGGENSPKLEGEDDFYELLMASLEAAGIFINSSFIAALIFLANIKRNIVRSTVKSVQST